MAQWKAKEKNFRQCLGKVLAVFAIFGMMVVTAGQAHAVDHYLLQNTDTGQTAYWELNSNGGLRNQTRGEGFDWLYGTQGSNFQNSMTPPWGPEGVYTPTSTPHLVWSNTDNGQYGFWKLNSNGALVNHTRGSGWDMTSPYAIPTLPSGWVIVKVLDASDTKGYHRSSDDAGPYDVLLIQNTDDGRTGFLRMNSDGQVVNSTKGNSWDLIDTEKNFAVTASSGWKIGPYFEGSGANDTLLLYNTANGQTGYWLINSNGHLVNTTKGDGWNMMTSTSDLFSTTGWRMVGISSNSNNAKRGDGGILYMHEATDTGGRTAWWALNSNGALLSNVAGTGWGFSSIASDLNLASPWEAKFVNSGSNGNTGNDQIVIQNTSTGQAGFIEIDSSNSYIALDGSSVAKGTSYDILWPGLPAEWTIQKNDDSQTY